MRQISMMVMTAAMMMACGGDAEGVDPERAAWCAEHCTPRCTTRGPVECGQARPCDYDDDSCEHVGLECAASCGAMCEGDGCDIPSYDGVIDTLEDSQDEFAYQQWCLDLAYDPRGWWCE